MAKFVFFQNIWVEIPAIMQFFAILKDAGHSCEAVVDIDGSVIKRIIVARPDAVAFSIMTVQLSWFLRAVRRLREAGYGGFIIAGGIYLTFDRELIHIDGLDAICIGEVDTSILELVFVLDSGIVVMYVHNLIVKSGDEVVENPLALFVMDLDGLLHMDRDVYGGYYFFRQIPIRLVVVSRGYPYICLFCSNTSLIKMYLLNDRKWYRAKSFKNAVKKLT